MFWRPFLIQAVVFTFDPHLEELLAAELVRVLGLTRHVEGQVRGRCRLLLRFWRCALFMIDTLLMRHF